VEGSMDALRQWQAALGQLQLEMPRAAFDTWVRDAELIAYEDGSYIVGVQNAYARDWLQDRLSATVKRILTGIAGRTVEVRFVVWQGEQAEESSEPPLLKRAMPGQEESRPESALNPRYVFDRFVVGSGNRLAYAAAQAVSESPAHAYNPLFLYGGVGLGKTHLLHAIGNACVQSGLQVIYVTSEEFTNDLINAIRRQETEAFRGRYRRAGVLLIDDIEFIAGKESTQEEFFHTFNALHAQDRQIVVSSDRPPKALVTLEERLRSRFEWGLSVDIQAPDFETRVAILREKAEGIGRLVESSHLEIIARLMQSNIRELEGALTRVLAFSDLSGVPLSEEMIEASLADFIPPGREASAELIIDAVGKHFGLDPQRMLSAERSQQVALPRQVAMYLLRDETTKSLPQIGRSLGGRDHTTVLYGCRKIAESLETDEKLRRHVAAIRERIYQRS
jgi:chromosomal replication initiator protein